MTTERWWSSLRPPPLRSVSQWADSECILPTESSALPGRWRTDTTPYLREIMDRLSVHDPCERVVCMVGSQLGKTSVAQNVLGYYVCDAPRPILIVQPSDDALKKFSAMRIAPMIRASPVLSERFAPARGRSSSSSMYQRDFAGGTLALASAQSPAQLASMAIGLLICDEVDRYPASSGSEGDPLRLAEQRTVTYQGRKILVISTPTLVGESRIARELGKTGWREYQIPCHHCGHCQPWELDDLRWESGRPETAAIHCRGCGSALDERCKPEMLRAGRWIPRHPERETGQTYGYQLESLAAPFAFAGLRWAEIARRWAESASDPLLRQAETNLLRGRPWDPAEAAPGADPDALRSRAEAYDAPVPAGALVITAGVDVQEDRIEASIWGWGEGEESWLIEHRILYGDPTSPSLWQSLEDLLRSTWPIASGARMGVDAACIDSGYLAHQVQQWCYDRRKWRIYAVKGGADPTRALWPTRASSAHGHRPVWVIGVGAGKQSLWRSMHVTAPGPGYIHTPSGEMAPDATWYAQLLAERPSVQRDGKIKWMRGERGVRSEVMDCRVYAHAALASMRSVRDSLASAAKRRAALDAASPTPPPQAPPVAAAPAPARPAAPDTPPRPRHRPRHRPRPRSWLDPGARLG